MELLDDTLIRPSTPEVSLIQRRETVYSYLDGLSTNESAVANSIADGLLETGKPLAQTVVLIPVAATKKLTYRARYGTV